MLMVEEEEDEVLEYIIKPLTSRLTEQRPDPGYSVKRWTDCIRHLAYPSVYTGDGPLIETPQRSEPPQGQEMESWRIFINRIVKEVAGIMRAATTTPEDTIKSTQQGGSSLSMPDTLKLAEQSLMLPKQEDESSSAVEQCMNTALRMKNPLRTDNETTSTSSRATMTKEEVLEEQKD
jgi:hypothetical protein